MTDGIPYITNEPQRWNALGFVRYVGVRVMPFPISLGRFHVEFACLISVRRNRLREAALGGSRRGPVRRLAARLHDHPCRAVLLGYQKG